MSLPTISSKADQLFRTLVSNKAVCSVLLDYLWVSHMEANTKLSAWAIDALTKPELIPHAQMQQGRVQLLKELIDQAEKYRSEKHVTNS